MLKGTVTGKFLDNEPMTKHTSYGIGGPGVNGKMVADFAQKSGHRSIYYIKTLDKLEKTLDNFRQPGDMIITLGAGNIWRYAESYMSHLQEIEAAA